MGNGHDTLFLADKVGPAGVVYAFDRQSSALAATRQRLHEHHQLAQVQLIEAGHETLLNWIAQAHHGRVKAILFNLGYLPGGDKSITTRSATTLQALNASLHLLAPHGRLSIIAYPGHPAGVKETETVKQWSAALPSTHYRTSFHIPQATRARPPEWIVVEPIETTAPSIGL